MGKGAILLVMATMIGGSIMLFQSDQTTVRTDERQSERQEEVLAREIARSGYSALIARTRQIEAQNPDASIGTIVDLVNGQTGQLQRTYQGGSYTAHLEQVSESGFIAVAVGSYGEASHRLNSHWVTQGTLEVTEESELEVEFEESMAGYCSAIFLERWIPKNNNGHGNNEDGCDMSNPGNKDCDDTDPYYDDEMKTGNSKGKGKYVALKPELIFASGHNRDNHKKDYTKILYPGERINFILAVDKNCSVQGDTTVSIWKVKGNGKGKKDEGPFDYIRPALDDNVKHLSEMKEGDFAMIEASRDEPGVWRIAFEDLVFDEDQLTDIKKNGYAEGWNKWRRTYGGNGWHYDSRGYRDLEDFGDIPDFSDQVILVRLKEPTSGSGGGEENPV